MGQIRGKSGKALTRLTVSMDTRTTCPKRRTTYSGSSSPSPSWSRLGSCVMPERLSVETWYLVDDPFEGGAVAEAGEERLECAAQALFVLDLLFAEGGEGFVVGLDGLVCRLDQFRHRKSAPDFGNLPRELRHGRGDYLPDYFEVQADIVVHDSISQPGHLPQGIDGWASLNSGGRDLAISPMISRFRTTASTVFSSLRKFAQSKPCT